jgi:hypothetical protein
MSTAPRPLDVSDQPELLRLAEEVHASGEARLLRRARQELAVLLPAKPRPRSSSRARPLAADDALFRLIGIGSGEVPGGVSGRKHEYLAQAYRRYL